MTKTLITCLFLIFTSPLFGQEVTPQDSVNQESVKKIRAVLHRLSDELQLSSDQKVSIKKILVRRQEALNAANELSESDKRQKVKQINSVARNRLSEILTNEQFDQYLSIREFLRKNREKNGKSNSRNIETDF